MSIIISDDEGYLPLGEEEDIDNLYGDLPKVMTPYRKSIADQVSLCMERKHDVLSGFLQPSEGLPAFLHMMETTGAVREHINLSDMTEDNPDELYHKLNELEQLLESLMLDKYILTGSHEIASRLRQSLHIKVVESKPNTKVDTTPSWPLIAAVVVALTAIVVCVAKWFDE